MKIAVINGPNLNMLGHRETDKYGQATYEQLCDIIRKKAASLGMETEIFQSNHEGQIIDFIHECCALNFDGIIINPGGLTHTSVSLADALRCFNGIVAEVHLTNIHKREEYRRHSYTAEAAQGIICGFGIHGYCMAVEYIGTHKRG